MLNGSFFMLQVYDRVLTSHSVPTLVALSVLAIGLYLIQGILDVLRGQVLVRLGSQCGVPTPAHEFITQALAPFVAGKPVV